MCLCVFLLVCLCVFLLVCLCVFLLVWLLVQLCFQRVHLLAQLLSVYVEGLYPFLQLMQLVSVYVQGLHSFMQVLPVRVEDVESFAQMLQRRDHRADFSLEALEFLVHVVESERARRFRSECLCNRRRHDRLLSAIAALEHVEQIL